MLGPFLDSKNKIISEGEMIIGDKYVKYDELFDGILNLILKESNFKIT